MKPSTSLDLAPAGSPLPDAVALAADGLLADDDANAALARFTADGLRCVLVTLVGIDGGSPRSPGAQMVVAEDGRYSGYLSGGCLEQTVVLEALAFLERGENKLVRFGKGSPYFDVRLPCGSGLDVFFDTGLQPAVIDDMIARWRQRETFILETDLDSGAHRVINADPAAEVPVSARRGACFARAYVPQPRLLLLGTGPTVTALYTMSRAAGLDCDLWAGDEPTRAALDRLAACHEPSHEPSSALFERIDRCTAVVVAFHDHDGEPKLLERLLATPCFYVGALGNHAVHRLRVARLQERGFTGADLARIRAPLGLIPGAKGQLSLSVGILCEIVAEAKARGILP